MKSTTQSQRNLRLVAPGETLKDFRGARASKLRRIHRTIEDVKVRSFCLDVLRRVVPPGSSGVDARNNWISWFILNSPRETVNNFIDWLLDSEERSEGSEKDKEA